MSVPPEAPATVPAAAAGPSGEPEYRIDELARMAGTTVRNVRAYQDRGLLPAPRRSGRVGLYSSAHLARIRLVAELLGRGYTLANIAELIAGWEAGRDLGELLGLETALIGSSAQEGCVVERSELVDLLGEEATRALLGTTEASRLAEADGGRVRVQNPRMLEGAAILIGAGVPALEVVALGAYLAEAVDGIARSYVEVVERHLFGAAHDPLPRAEIPRLTALVRRLRPLAKQVVDAELALALDRRIQAEIGDRLSRMLPGEPAAGVNR